MTQSDFAKAVEQNMALLGISREEAEELVRFDNGETDNSEADALTAKAKANHTYISSGVRKKVDRPHKVDADKQILLGLLQTALSDTVNMGKVTNESSFDFEYGGLQYTVKLVKHR